MATNQEYHRKYYKDHKNKIRATAKAYHRANRDACLEKMRRRNHINSLIRRGLLTVTDETGDIINGTVKDL